MSDFTPITESLSYVVDLLTAGYRFAYQRASGTDGVSPGWIAPSTWLFGSMFTFGVMGLLAFAWHGLIFGMRWRARALLDRATLGANLQRVRGLVDQYVRLDRVAVTLQNLSRVRFQSPATPPPDAYTRRARGSLAAALVLGMPALVRGLVLGARLVATTTWGLLSLLATWWAMGCPGLASAVESVNGWQESDAFHLTPTGVGLVGVVLAALSFVLSRMRGANAVGRQAWRRSEAAHACAELADRETEIDKALAAMESAEWAIHSSWESFVLEPHQSSAWHVADRVTELCRLLALPLDDCTAPIRGPLDRGGSSPRSQAVKEAVEAVEKLRRHLDGVTGRRETRIHRCIPWRVVRQASVRRLRGALATIDRYLDIPTDLDLGLTSADHYARRAAVAARHRVTPGFDLAGLDPESIPIATRREIVDQARKAWKEEIEQAERDREHHAHHRLIHGLIGTAELRIASDTIYAYVHPTGP